jgi:hypothetical protein
VLYLSLVLLASTGQARTWRSSRFENDEVTLAQQEIVPYTVLLKSLFELKLGLTLTLALIRHDDKYFKL